MILFVLENSDNELVRFITNKLDINPDYIYDVAGLVGIQDIDQICKVKNPKLRFKHFTPREVERLKEYNDNFFETIKKKDLVVHHPFETFDSVIEFLNQAANDKKVIAIKQTLYRTTPDSPIVRALCQAAENGKTVTALVELKARFDEANNINVSRKLEKAGAQVVYGFMDWKTHAKLSTVVRQEGKVLRTYTHVGTGNYHPDTAKIYTDLSLFTSDASLGRDVTKVFNYLSGYIKPTDLESMIIAPLELKSSLIEMIKNEISLARKGKPAEIWVKLNALIDPEVIDVLY